MKNDFLYRELISEKAAIWFISDGDNFELRVKAPTVVLMAIIQGAMVDFIFTQEVVDEHSFLIYACLIKDDQKNPFIISGIIRRKQEQDILSSVLQGIKTNIVLYNELDMPVAWTDKLNISLDEYSIKKFISEKVYCGKYIPEQEIALDHFEKNFSANVYNFISDNYLIQFRINVQDWTCFETITFLGKNPISSRLDTNNVGGYLENLVATAIDVLFTENVFKNPFTGCGEKQRELTDVFAFYDRGLFLVETKALAINNKIDFRDMERKITGVKKQIKKAIKQLQGASKAIRRGDIIKTTSGDVIHFNRKIIPHCIIVVSEIFHADEYRDVVLDLFNASLTSNCYFHILDLKNLLMLIKASCHETLRPERFDCALIKLFENLVKTENINIEIRMDAPYSKD